MKIGDKVNWSSVKGLVEVNVVGIDDNLIIVKDENDILWLTNKKTFIWRMAMTKGSGKMSMKLKREDKGTPKEEAKMAKSKSPEKPRSADMGHVTKAAEHMKAAEMHHREAKKHMAKCKK